MIARTVVFGTLFAAGALQGAVAAQDPVALVAADVASVDTTTDSVVASALAAPLSLRERRLSARVRDSAARDTALRVLVSLEQRELRVLRAQDTLLVAPVGIGRDATLAWEGKVWRFATPRGIRTVREKAVDPVWTPPDWHYVEVARTENLKLKHLRRDRPVKLASGDLLAVRLDVAGLVRTSGVFDTLAENEELIFGDTLFIPPVGTRNRRVKGVLGRFKFDLGDGYLFHGTPDTSSIGNAATHGCLRLHDADLEWLHANVPVGTRVYIH